MWLETQSHIGKYAPESIITTTIIITIIITITIIVSSSMTRFLQNQGIQGEFHDQGDAKWIVIRRQLRGHNDTPFGRPTPGRPIGRPGLDHPLGILVFFQLLLISNILF
jgi:hypothetical protein